MDRDADYIKLVKEAQLRDEENLNRLAELARPRLGVYVYRLTLADDLTQDIVQETILEMYKIFGNLKQADRFWGWLYGIALNKLRRHRRSRRGRQVNSGKRSLAVFLQLFWSFKPLFDYENPCFRAAV